MKIFLLYGGKSEEHDIAILSAHSIIQNIYYDFYEVQPVFITREGDWIKGRLITEKEGIPSVEDMALVLPDDDHAETANVGVAMTIDELKEENSIAFPVLHGPNGEDGTIQGLFETIGIPYVGCGVLASSTGMDKSISKVLFQEAGLPQVPYEKVWRRQWESDEREVVLRCEATMIYPMFVKPSNLGSSVGISQCNDRDSLISGIEEAFRFDRTIVVEQGVEAKEVEVALLGNDDIHTSVPGELVKKQGFYDYESKYIDNTVEMKIPAAVGEEVSRTVRDYASRAFAAIEGSGLARADFFVTENDEVFINEVNTFPGFTQFSMYPSLWEATGLSYSDLIEELIQLGLQRFNERQGYFSEER